MVLGSPQGNDLVVRRGSQHALANKVFTQSRSRLGMDLLSSDGFGDGFRIAYGAQGTTGKQEGLGSSRGLISKLGSIEGMASEYLVARKHPGCPIVFPAGFACSGCHERTKHEKR